MTVAVGGPRLLLRRLREIMAEPASAQTRLGAAQQNLHLQRGLGRISEHQIAQITIADAGSRSGE